MLTPENLRDLAAHLLRRFKAFVRPKGVAVEMEAIARAFDLGALFGAGVEEIDEVDGVIGSVDADEADGESDVGGTGLAVDDVEDLLRDGFGLLDFGAGGAAETNRELAGIDGRENFEAEARADVLARRVYAASMAAQGGWGA